MMACKRFFRWLKHPAEGIQSGKKSVARRFDEASS
jgi:hypothetical protein